STFRADYAYLVHHLSQRGDLACYTKSNSFDRDQSAPWHRVPYRASARRVSDTWRRVPRGHGVGSAICRPRTFWPPSDPGCVAVRRPAGAYTQLPWTGCPHPCRSKKYREPVL